MFIVFSFRNYSEKRCPRGCCYEGSTDADARLAFFSEKDKAAEHIAILDPDKEYSHKIAITGHMDGIDGKQFDGDGSGFCGGEYTDESEANYDIGLAATMEILNKADEFRIQNAAEAKAKAEARKIAEAERKAKEDEERKAREAVERREWELQQLAELKAKYE